MGIYIFTWSKLKAYLIENENANTGSKDFGKDIIPSMLKNEERLFAYEFEGYWKDVGTLDSLWEANRWISMTHSGRFIPDTTTCRRSM